MSTTPDRTPGGAPGNDTVLMELVESVLALSASARPAFLENVRRTNPALCADVMSRVEWEERMAGFLRDPIIPSRPAGEPPTEPVVPAADLTGSTISHYRITEKIGAGGMGVVYKAEDTRLQRTVALKFLPSESMPEEARQRFVQEARAAARVHHPNICPVFEIGEEEGRLFFAMAFIEGQTLAHLAAEGTMPIDTALNIAIQIADGLEAAHQQGIVHRDIKSGNIVVDRNGHACILDFGLALRPDVERLTVPGGAIGTPAWMSPEQAQGLKVDCHTDLWSLGVVLFQMLTGRLPFHRDTQFSVLYAIVNQEPPPVSSLRAEAGPELGACLRKALAKDPGLRWQSAAEFAAELRRLQLTQGRASPAAIPAPDFTPPKSWPKSAKLTLAAAVLTVALLALAGPSAFHRFQTLRESLPEQKQIAVLPFEIIGSQDDETMRALADGLVETLTAKLSQVEDFQGKLLVVPASEIRSRKITTIEAARRIYGANLAFTGNVQRWGNKIQFNQVLADTATVRQLGSSTFEFEADRPIALRDMAVDGAVRLLALKLTPATTTAMKSGETSMPEAYGAYLTGSGYLARYDVRGNTDRAIARLEVAISRDPRYALAHAALGEAHWRKAKQTSDRKQADLALTSIREALRIDPRLTAARIMLGEIYSENGQPELAIKEEMTALRIVPGSAQAYRALGAAYAATSRFSEAEGAYREGVNRQPADWYGHLLLGFFYLQRERTAEARSAFETARKLTPDNEVVYSNLAGLDVLEGKYQDALDLYSKTLKFQPGARSYAAIGFANYYLRRYAEAAEALNKSIELDPAVYQTWGNLGVVYGHLPGSEEMARQSFHKAIEMATRNLQVLRGDFRSHANLAEYWAHLGDRSRSLREVAQIPESARGPYVDRIVIAYELTGDRQRAIQAVRSIPLQSSMLNSLKNDPNLERLWSEIAAPPQSSETK